ncbi:hypothetical protein GV64_18710 [Endozoicomonas elysicola]|uniref:Uncharacterized protein n=1 Tax=Endozoicomonas elysicola TaxID=305900 RepID=A0A081KEB5_9GAMM|nr:hypothetical protein GV64_18710 [Endozoicomonas elysicola]
MAAKTIRMDLVTNEGNNRGNFAVNFSVKIVMVLIGFRTLSVLCAHQRLPKNKVAEASHECCNLPQR